MPTPAAKPPAPPAPPVPAVETVLPEPKSNAVAILMACLAGIFGLIIISSAMNTNNYYLKQTKGAVEIWQGKFSPTGKKLIISVPGAVIEKPVKAQYSRSEAMAPAFNYYIKKAEALTEIKGPLDFEEIKHALNTALAYAFTTANQKEVKSRINKIDFTFLTYKADVATGKKTLKGYEKALQFLDQASALTIDKAKKGLLKNKKDSIKEAIGKLNKKKAADIKKKITKEAAKKKSEKTKKTPGPKKKEVSKKNH